MRVLVALFLVGHGLLHAIYVGQARRLFQVQPGANWPDGSWALSRVWGDPATRWMVAVVFALVAAAFAVAGAALLLRAPLWAPGATSAAVGVEAHDVPPTAFSPCAATLRTRRPRSRRCR